MVKNTVENEKACSDPRCPFHGTISTRGKTYEGVVSSNRMQSTVIVTWPRVEKSKKYDRFVRLSSKVKAHVPGCLTVQMGDKVEIRETRRQSRTVNFVVLKVLKENKGG